MFLIKRLYQFVKDSFVALSINVIKNLNMFQNISIYPKTFYLNSFLLSTSTFLQNLQHRTTGNHCRNRYIINRKSHSRGIAAYLYSQLTKLLLTSRIMNYPRKNLIYLNHKKSISRILLILISTTKNLLLLYYVNIASYETLEKIKISYNKTRQRNGIAILDRTLYDNAI